MPYLYLGHQFFLAFVHFTTWIWHPFQLDHFTPPLDYRPLDTLTQWIFLRHTFILLGDVLGGMFFTNPSNTHTFSTYILHLKLLSSNFGLHILFSYFLLLRSDLIVLIFLGCNLVHFLWRCPFYRYHFVKKKINTSPARLHLQKCWRIYSVAYYKSTTEVPFFSTI